MENIPLYIPPNKRVKGLVVYCYKCKTNIVSGICKTTGKSIKQCPNGEKHAFKVYVHVPGTKNERRTKTLDTRDINEAIKQALDFEREVKENKPRVKEDIEKKTEVIKDNQKKNKPHLLVHALARYIGWLSNEGVPAHLVKERSADHIKDNERAFERLVECLKESGYNLRTLSVEDIDDEMVGKIYSYLSNRNFANRTFNKHFSYYTSFLKWYTEEYNYPSKNWFERAKRKKLNPNPEAITQSEYEALLKQITPENGIKTYENGVKPIRSLYRTWLTSGIRLALETGLRRENVNSLKWINIQESEGIPYIKVEDLKVNRTKNWKTENEKKFNYLPVTKRLKKLLEELDYEKHKNTEEFILAPDVKISRNKVMSDVFSRGFTHYYSQLNTGKNLTYKCLRKTYITSLKIYLSRSNDLIKTTGHSSNAIVESSYIDKVEMAKALRNFCVFPDEYERTKELAEVREKANAKQTQINKEV